MRKLKVSELLALMDHPDVGYKGEKSPPKMLEWLVSEGAQLQVHDSKDPIDAKEFELDDDTGVQPRNRVFSIPQTVKAAGSVTPITNVPPDWEAKLDAAVSERLKRMGIVDVNGRPKLQPGEPEVKVGKTMRQVIYEDQAKAGKTFFKTYEMALLGKHFLDIFVPISAENYAEAEARRKSFSEMAEKVHGKAYTTSSATAVGPLVPDMFIPDLIRNVTEAGVARSLARVVVMEAQRIIFPRRTGGPTIVALQENTAPSQTGSTYDNVTLDAKTVGGIVQISNQALQDAGLSVVDITFQDFATAIAQFEDDCYFSGQGGATHAGITGLENTINYAATAATAGNTVVGADTADAHTAAQISVAIAAVPKWARANMRITCSDFQKSNIFDRLSVSVPGGLTLKELTGFGLINAWQGIPIVTNNSMNAVNSAGSTARGLGFTAGDQIDFFIGDFGRSTMFGDRMQVEMAVSRERGFDSYSTYLRVVERFDLNIHSIGSATTAGGVIAFYQT